MNLNWKTLGFNYIQTNSIFVSHYKDGKWSGGLQKDPHLKIHVSASSLHYGQQCFEGMKAYRAKDGGINLFRPFDNAKRLNTSANRLLMQEVDENYFVESIKKVVLDNQEFIPPYGTDGALYIRPSLIGVGANVGVKPANEYLFTIFVTPVGAYFKNGLEPVSFTTTIYDRAAPMGTGKVKVGGNYASSLYPHKIAKDQGFQDCIYLDPLTHTKIEEVGAANFFAITKDNEFVTPDSESILPSITKRSLIQIAKDLNMKVKIEDVFVDKLDIYKEAGACGTAAVITPIGSIVHNGKKSVFYSETEVGPTVKKLYEILTGIQRSTYEDKHGWILKIG